MRRFVAFVASPLVRTGFSRVADPDAGRWVDGPLLAVSALAMGIALLGACTLVAVRVATVRGGGSVRERPAWFSRASSGSPSAVVGLAAAGGGLGVVTRRLARSTLIAVTVTSAGAIAALVWWASSST